jgi:uncharacterized protein (DUF433 family)
MSTTTAVTPLVVETPRGPSIAGTRITIYSLMDYLKLGLSRNYTKASFRISDEELDAAIEYIEQHREQVERNYARILQREAEARARSEQIMRERSPFPPDMPLEERKKLMLEKIRTMKETGNFPGASTFAKNGSTPREKAPRRLDAYEICMMAYLALEYIENGSREKLPTVLSIAPDELEKVYRYIDEHREEMERDKELTRHDVN